MRSSYFDIPGPGGAIPSLDGLRAIAILLVLARHGAAPFHDGWEFTGASLGQQLAVALTNGWVGVDLFFVLSGFLVTSHLLARQREPGHGSRLLGYWLKRALRTFPAYYAVLAWLALIGVPHYEFSSPDCETQLLWHVIFMQDYTGSCLVPAFWSLGVEEKFYLACPLALLLLNRIADSRLRVRLIILIALLPMALRAATMALNPPVPGDYTDFFMMMRSPTHLVFDGLWLGVICALITRHHRHHGVLSPRARLHLLWSGVLACTLLIGVRPILDLADWWPMVPLLLLIPLAFSFIVLAVATGPTPLDGWLGARPLRFFSAISYSLYLTHMLCIPAALALAESILSDATPSATTRVLAFAVTYLALAVGSSVILHLGCEKPFLILKSKIRL